VRVLAHHSSRKILKVGGKDAVVRLLEEKAGHTAVSTAAQILEKL